jgi:polysaccharide export outer membrane protein
MTTARLFAAALFALTIGAAGLPAAAQPATVAAAPAAAANEYRLGSGDVIRISVYQNPDLTLETRVTEAGVVSLPLLGSVRIGGKSVTEAEKFIADGLRTGNFVKQL